tara:strand:+ start:724 stop:1338 length:615 start_codon:yes stop_codon:yes gene_type:complete
MPLVYDFNNDGVVNGADVVYFASAVAGVDISNFNIANLQTATTGKLLKYTYINSLSLPEFVVEYTPRVVSDFSLNITPLYKSSKIHFNISFNYLTSCFPNTMMQVEYFYNVNNNIDISFGKSILGTENTNFIRNSLNLNIITDPMSGLSGNDGAYTINYKIKASIYSAPGTNDFVTTFNLLDNNKPKLLLNEIGNSIILSELEG